MASENCSIASINPSDSSIPGCGQTETITRTWTAIDGSGNPSSCEQTIIVEDKLAPDLAVDTTPIFVTDADCSGDEAVTLPTASATDACDVAPVVDDDAPVIFLAGVATPVIYSATDACGNSSISNVNVTVLYGADIAIRANKHTVGSGNFPGSIKEPLVGIEVCAYDKSAGSCARDTCGGISHQHYGCIVTSCAPVSCCTTDTNGECTINAPPGDYLVISDDATKTVLPDPLGVSASDLVCGELKQKHLQQIIRSDGKKLPGKTKKRTGSELLIIEPEFMEWTSTTELYPVVFASVGDWNADTEVTPPEGFVSDYDSLAEQVTDEIEAVQFILTDIGSDWIPTETTFVLTHKGRREVVLSRIGVKLSEKLAQAKGLDRDGRTLDAKGKPMSEQGFNPRDPFPAEIVGWIEPSQVDADWTVKLHVEESSELTLAVTRGQGEVLETLADGYLEAGDYEFTVPRGALGPGLHFLTLACGKLVQKVPLTDR